MDFRLTKYGQQLVEENINYIYYVAKKYCRDGLLHVDDRMSIANEVLIIGVAKYNPHKTQNLKGYIRTILINTIYREVRKKLIAIPVCMENKMKKFKEKSNIELYEEMSISNKRKCKTLGHIISARIASNVDSFYEDEINT